MRRKILSLKHHRFSVRHAVEVTVGVVGLTVGLVLVEFAAARALLLMDITGSMSFIWAVRVLSLAQGVAGGLLALIAGVTLMRAEPYRLARSVKIVASILTGVVVAVLLVRPPQPYGPDMFALLAKVTGVWVGLRLATANSFTWRRRHVPR